MRILIVNPNTSRPSTDTFVSLAKAAASPSTEIRGATGGFGVELMRRPAELAIGVHAMLDAVAEHGNDCDAVIIAAFGDYGAAAAADLFKRPVMTLADAAFAAVRLARRRYAILTPGPGFGSLIGSIVPNYGASDTLVGIGEVTVPPNSPGYADHACQALDALVSAHAPECVMLVGPPLAAHVELLRQSSAIPLIEAVSCAVRLTEAIAPIAPASLPAIGNGPGARVTGLSSFLTNRLAGES
ncbi:MAG: aspartate/glutamate racemase family protein [Pseudomonadota bacterium]